MGDSQILRNGQVLPGVDKLDEKATFLLRGLDHNFAHEL